MTTTSDQSKAEAFRTKIEQRKACEKKAMNTAISLIEEDKVTNETLINAVIDNVSEILAFFLFIYLVGYSD